jgi:hypothetical protein
LGLRDLTPAELNSFLTDVHTGVDIPKHLEIQFQDVTFGTLKFAELYFDCMKATGTETAAWKEFRRMLRAYFLARYFDAAAGAEGGVAECGVMLGFSSLMMARMASSRRPGFSGEDFHLVDSFEGLSEPRQEDAIDFRQLPSGEVEPVYPHKKGFFSSPLDIVKSSFTDFPALSFHKGWIPEILSSLPERKWKFVHIDVDLFEPTRHCLEYFLPRMEKGGCIINDDFDSPLFPGGGMGWFQVMNERNLHYAVLDSGQAVYIHD